MDSIRGSQGPDEGVAGLAPESVEAARKAHEELARAVQIAKLTNDPLRPVLEGLSAYMEALHYLLVDSCAVITRAVRQPINEAVIVDRLGKEAARIMNAHAQQFLFQARRRTLLTAAAVLVGVSALCLGGGYYWGFASTSADIQTTEAALRAAFASDPEAAKVWVSLMQWNDPRKALAQCRGQRIVQQGGRHGCDVPLWIEP